VKEENMKEEIVLRRKTRITQERGETKGEREDRKDGI
jgi:hypothetical protein